MVLRYGELIARGYRTAYEAPRRHKRDGFVRYRVWLKVVPLSKGKDGLEIELECVIVRVKDNAEWGGLGRIKSYEPPF